MTITNKQTVCVNSGFAHPADTTKQVQFDMSGITANTPAVIAVPDASGTMAYTESGTFTGTLTGCTTSPTVTFDYTKVGNMVSLAGQTQFSATSNATTKTITGMPVSLRPSTSRKIIALTVDNGGTRVASLGVIGADGVITLYKDVSGSAFTASGTFSHVTDMAITYPL